jgi:hypothetical protein
MNYTKNRSKNTFALSVQALQTYRILFFLFIFVSFILFSIHIILINNISVNGYLLTKSERSKQDLLAKSEELDIEISHQESNLFLAKKIDKINQDLVSIGYGNFYKPGKISNHAQKESNFKSTEG